LSIFHTVGTSSLANNLLNLALLIAVVTFYCKRSTTPAVRAWNYACWIIIAITQAGAVIVMFIISAAVTAGAVVFGSLINASGSGNTTGAQVGETFATTLTVICWVVTALAAVPMIVSSVVAHQNRAPCSCSTRSDYVD
jgi:hypothetical protein